MPKANRTSTTVSARAEAAATFAVILLKASLLGPRHGGALVEVEPDRPVLTGGAALKMKAGV